MSTVIEVENISKSYLLNHQHAKPYLSLREEMMTGLHRLGKSIFSEHQTHEHADTFWALKDVSFSINAGERVGIIGRNGAGKSTLLKILSRVTRPTTGRIKLTGRLGSLLEVGTGFHPELTGRENIFLNGAILGMSRKEIRKQFSDIVEFAEVDRFLDTPVKRYSSGMYVRLAFSIAAHFEPDLLILDEVLAVGDQKFQKKCFERIQELGKESGRAVILVSHSMTALTEICSRSLVFESGKIVFDGKTSSGIAHYLAHNSSSQTKTGDIVSLENWHNRKGLADRAKISWVQIDSNHDDKLFRIGTDLIIRFAVIFPDQINANELVLAISLHSIFGTQIANMLNTDSQFKPGILHNECIFEVCFSDIRLYPGSYSLSFWVGTDSTPIDHAIECIKFEVLEGEGATRRLPTDCGMHYFTPSWKVLT